MESSKYFIDYPYSLNNLYVTDKSLALNVSGFFFNVSKDLIVLLNIHVIIFFYCNLHISTYNVNTAYSTIITASQM